MTGDLVKAVMWYVRSSIYGGISTGSAWAPGAILSSRIRYSLCDSAQQDRVSFYTCWSGGVRHGGVRHASASGWSGTLQRPSFFIRGATASACSDEAERWGFFNRLCAPEALLKDAQALAAELATGPTFAHGMTKKMLHQEWNMGVDEAIDARSAGVQAICMATNDFHRRYLSRFCREAEARVQGRLRMADSSFLDWPFFEERHRKLAKDLEVSGFRAPSGEP